MKKAALSTLVPVVAALGVALALILPGTGGGTPIPTPPTTTIVVPTDKAQCKDGGWQTFGVFKNQGDCVSFVATGGSNPPG